MNALQMKDVISVSVPPFEMQNSFVLMNRMHLFKLESCELYVDS